MKVWYCVLYCVIWPFFNLFRPIRAVGREHIPEGPAIICPNHTTIGDPFYVVFAFGYRWTMRAMAKVQIMRLPFIGWILSKAGVFGVNRDNTDLKAVKTAMKFLKEGDKLLMFPEGTRVEEEGGGVAKGGVAVMASRTGTPMVPVYCGTKQKFLHRTTIVFGEPYSPVIAGRRATAEESRQAAEEILRRIYALDEVSGWS